MNPLVIGLGIVVIALHRPATGAEPLRPEWIARDTAGAALVGKLMPIREQISAPIYDIFDVGVDRLDSFESGFGGRRISVRKGYGYTSMYLEAFEFDGRLARFKMGIDGSSLNWSSVRATVMEAWTKAGGPKYECNDSGCFHEGSDEGTLLKYKRAVAAVLGEIKRIDPPGHLQRHYEYLMSPFEVIYVGLGGCGLAGPMLRGREAIDLIAHERNLELLTNVLRGYNPGGRVYALLALSELQEKGVRIPAETKQLMRRVQRLKIPVTTCVGCIVSRGLFANEVVKRFQ